MNRGGFGGDGFGGGGGSSAGMVQNYRFSEAVENAAAPAWVAVGGGVTGGQQFVVNRASICTGCDVTWATSGGAGTLTLELWDDGGTVIASATCSVSGTATRQTVNWATPVNLLEDDLLGKLLVVSAFQQSANEYYSDIGATQITAAAPQIVGPGVISYGNIYSAGHAFPATNTAAETYGLDVNLREILWQQHERRRRASNARTARRARWLGPRERAACSARGTAEAGSRRSNEAPAPTGSGVTSAP